MVVGPRCDTCRSNQEQPRPITPTPSRGVPARVSFDRSRLSGSLQRAAIVYTRHRPDGQLAPAGGRRARPGRTARVRSTRFGWDYLDYQRRLSTTRTPSSSWQSEEMPRPDISFETLAAMAILCSPEEKLTFKEICRFVADKFPYFMQTQPLWWPSIKCTLGINGVFKEAEEAGDGEGCYWVIDTEQFLTLGEGALETNTEPSLLANYMV